MLSIIMVSRSSASKMRIGGIFHELAMYDIHLRASRKQESSAGDLADEIMRILSGKESTSLILTIVKAWTLSRRGNFAVVIWNC